MPGRVLHIAQPVDAGVARWIVDHAPRQRAAGWDVRVACPPTGWLAEALADVGVPVHEWPARREPHRGVLAECRRLRRVVATNGPDLVHLHSSKAGLDGRLVLRGRLPTVFSPHAWSFEAVGGPTAAAARRWEVHAGRWADRILTVSEAERVAGERAGIAAQWATVANGVDLATHRPADDGDRERARPQLGLERGRPVVVCVGRLSPQKGQDLLIAAWPAVRAAVPGALLVLVGDGPDADELRRDAREDVRLVGPADDPRPWYAAASVVVVPSRWEGMAFVPLEAMAAARPVVAFDVTGMAEAIPPGAGALVPAGDTEALATALVQRLGDATQAAGEGRAGRAHIEQHHDADVLAIRVLAVYDDVLASRRGEGQAGRRE